MIGMPNQSYDEVIKTVEFTKKLKIKAKLTQFSPIPHTKLGDAKLGDEFLKKYDTPDP